MIRRLWTLADGWGQQMGQRSEPPSAHSAARRGRSRRQRATVRARRRSNRSLAARNPVAPSDLWPLNAKQVQMWLGHHAPAFTLSAYVHLLPKTCRMSTLPRTSLPRRLAARSQAPLMSCLTPNLEQPSRRPTTSSNLDQCGDSDPSCPPGGVASTAADCGAPVASIRQPTCSRTASAKRTRSRWRTVRQISTCASDWCFGP